MKRFLCSALFLTAACSPPPELPARPPAMTTTGLQHEVAPPPPLPPSFWATQLLTSGGFSGSGRGSIAMRSDESASARSGCRLPEAQRLAVERAVAEARPKLWHSSYKREKWSGMTDQFHYLLHLRLKEGGGEEETVYRAGWQDDSVAMLPADLRALSDALVAAIQATNEPCGKEPAKQE